METLETTRKFIPNGIPNHGMLGKGPKLTTLFSYMEGVNQRLVLIVATKKIKIPITQRNGLADPLVGTEIREAIQPDLIRDTMLYHLCGYLNPCRLWFRLNLYRSNV